jgi:hypothetical protein
MHSTFEKGEIAMLKVQLRALEKGVVVSKPTVESRYDLILDFNGKLFRAQVKYAGDELGGAVQLDLRKETRNNGKKKVYLATEIDAVLVYIPQIDAVLWLPPDKFHGKQSINIRFNPCKNHQKSGISLANDLRW